MAVNPGPSQSPWSYEDRDYLGRLISIVLNFDNTTRVIISGTVHRDPGCLYKSIAIGVGPDGTPDTATKKFGVPDGDTPLNLQQLHNNGINVIEDVEGLQVTATFS